MCSLSFQKAEIMLMNYADGANGRGVTVIKITKAISTAKVCSLKLDENPDIL